LQNKNFTFAIIKTESIMKKMLLFPLFIVLFTMAASSQISESQFQMNTDAEKSPTINNDLYLNLKNKANWDLQRSLNITTPNTGVGQAAVAYVNNQFWTSKWASDTLIIYTNAGVFVEKFVISGLTGVRAITSDGTYLYMATNTNTIYRVNPTTKLLAPPHITSASANTSRFLTYDQTLNSGAGGFWTGNFNTTIDAISMSGAVLASIPAATHTLTGMYGAAIDNTSAGGPYLWVFHQGGANTCQITALQLPSGTPTVHTRDAFLDVSTTHGLTSGLAGGMFFSTTLVSGEVSLIGLIQGSPNNVLFAYEIDLSANVQDIAAEGLRPLKGYTMIPENQVFPETFSVSYANFGTQTVDTVYAYVDFLYNGTPFHSETLSVTNVASGGTGVLTTTPQTPNQGSGNYAVFVTIGGPVGFVDDVVANDTMSFHFEVTDSIFARDNGISTGSDYSVSSTDWAYAASLYELVDADTLLGIWIQIETPIDGDTTFAVVYNHDGVIPTTELLLGEVVIIQSAVNDYFLPLENPLPLSAGNYAFGCYEGANTTINLAQSVNVFTSGTNYYFLGSTSSWSNSNIQTARFIRPIFKSYDFTNISELNLNHVSVYPNPTYDHITIDFQQTLSEQVEVEITDMNGKLILSNIISTGINSVEIDLNNINSGIYFITLSGTTYNYRQKIIVL
jgi:hypothetical protein